MGKPFGVGKKIYPEGGFKLGYWLNAKFVEGCKLMLNHLL